MIIINIKFLKCLVFIIVTTASELKEIMAMKIEITAVATAELNLLDLIYYYLLKKFHELSQ